MDKKPRNHNFSEEEKIRLVELVSEFSKVVENKLTDAVGWDAKTQAWAEIANKFNCISKSNVEPEKLKNCWNNLKQQTRKYYSKLKTEIYKTGGGSNKTKPNILYDKVYQIIQPTVDGLYNSNDSDRSIYMGETATFVSNVIESDEEIEDDLNLQQDEHVFQYLKDTNQINTWKKWNPRTLKAPLSDPLSTNIKKQKAAMPEKKSTHENLDNILIKSKIELTNLMTQELKEKSRLEKAILRQKLTENTLKIKLLESTIRGNKENNNNVVENIDISDISE
ncbi:myb/SANT-like DNA-binding domain-containing protein 3 [Prorops nasuta]|uniref:myb/SANT-like DNA-binding domain-containing protein 3 n=1 Tax=Prorops nasuta TaxID=863751 RepID=UPI0034CEA5B9